MSNFSTVRVTSAALKDHLGGLRDLTQQLGDLLSNPAPGGIVAAREELTSTIQQAQAMVDEASSKLAELEGLSGLLTQHLSVILGALDQVGVTKLEFAGPAATVIAEHGQAMSESSTGAQLYGLTILAATPDARSALKSLLGTGRAMLP